MDDDNTQWVPEASTTRDQEEQQRKADIKSSIPAIRDMIDWFDKQIEYYQDAVNYDITPKTDPEVVKMIVLTSKHFVAEYRRQRQQFVSDFNQYIEVA